jgi:UDP-N-acetyl-D-glucosamine dehydrogenase
MLDLIKKIDNKEAVIGIIGLGYVGLPLAICYQKAGYRVLGFDIDQEKISILANGKTYIKHIASESIKNMIDHGFKATSDFTKINEVDAIIICVPTPLNKYREPDLSFVIDTMEAIMPYIKPNQILSLESTTYPGTTDEEIVPRVIKMGLTVGENYYVVYSPEREDPGNTKFSTHNIPKVLGGFTNNCTEVGSALYRGIVNKVVNVSSTKTAEMVKLLENIHRSVNIGLVNEMKMIADKMGIDIHEVIKAAASKPFGFTPYNPGPGVGGHCIPIDPFYLTWKAREFGLHTRFIELAGEINCMMPDYVAQKVAESLNNRGKAVRGSKILILGIAYKKNVDDARESPSLEIMEILKSKGANLSYSDPYFEVFPKFRMHKFDLKSIELNENVVKNFDCIIVATDHDDFDYVMIQKNAVLIVDTRGRYNSKLANILVA